MHAKTLLKIGSLLTAMAASLSAASAAEGANSSLPPQAPVTNQVVKQMQDDFLKLKFGMFIHYNMASYKGVPWVAGYHSPADFNPGGNVDTDAWADAAESAAMNWWDWKKKGTPFLDIAVKENREFPEANPYPGETCWALEQGWFWKEGAQPKPAKQIVELLNRANQRHSNFLLNVGPNKQGRFEEASVKVLAEIGKVWRSNVAQPEQHDQ